MKITVLISETGHLVMLVFITTFFYYPFCILFTFSKHLGWSWFFTRWSDPNLHS